jgi:hypothetical protein
MLLALSVSSAQAQFSELVQRVPDSANTIFLWNVEKVLDSEVALNEGWRSNFEKAVAGGITHLPPDTVQYVMAAQIDFEYMQAVWHVGVLGTKQKHDMVYIASKQNGKQDTIAGLAAVLLPSNNYLVELSPTAYGMLVPASRQAVSRWIETTSDKEPRFSAYIQEAIGYADEAGTEVIMALDLTDVLDLATIEGLANESKILADAKVSPEAASKVLASLRGVMLGITFGKNAFGSIKVDFAEDASPLKDVAAELLLESLGKHGAMIDDFAKWTCKVEGKQVRLSGTLSSTGLRKVFSLMDSPAASTVAAGTQQPAQGQDTGDQDSPVAATQKYFAAVNQYIKDLRDKEPQRIAQYGIWFDKYAKKIDELPMLNVDREMLDYGDYVAQQFRNAGSAIQGIGIRSRVREVNTGGTGAPGYWGSNFDGGYSYGGYYYGGNNVVGAGAAARGSYVNNAMKAGILQQQRARTQISAEEKAMGTSAARQIVKDIDQATAYMRRQMTEKFKVEF